MERVASCLALLLPAALFVGCGGDSSPLLAEATLEIEGYGTSTLQMHYAGGRLVGATQTSVNGFEREWTISVDDEGRLTERSGMSLEADAQIRYSGDSATLTNGWGDYVFELDDAGVRSMTGPARSGSMLVVTDTSAGTDLDYGSGDVWHVTSDGPCGSSSMALNTDTATHHIDFECADNQSVTTALDGVRSQLTRDSEGRVVMVETTQNGSLVERLTLNWREPGPLGPPLTIGARTPAGDHLDASGHFDPRPRMLTLNLGGLVARY